MIFRIFCSLGFCIDFVWLWGGFLVTFWYICEVILVTFPGFAKNAAPHELTVNTDQIEGRAPVKASQKASKNEEKTG